MNPRSKLVAGLRLDVRHFRQNSLKGGDVSARSTCFQRFNFHIDGKLFQNRLLQPRGFTDAATCHMTRDALLEIFGKLQSKDAHVRIPNLHTASRGVNSSIP